MTAAELIGQVLAAGGRIAADGPDLVLTAPRSLPGELLGRLKANKPDILAALAQPGGRYGVTVDAEAQDLQRALRGAGRHPGVRRRPTEARG